VEDIKLLKIEYEYSIFYMDGTGNKKLCSIKVEFDYKKIERCELRIKTDKELSIEEIKERIWREIQ